jgi:paired amphipathic helix protein Sin3a
VPNDTKEKSSDKGGNADIIRLFKCDRERREFTKERGEYQELISYRRSIEKMLAPEDSVYRIDWNEENKEAAIRYVPRNEMTIANELDKDERWNYYIQTYMMCAPTEGIPLGRCDKVFLARNRPSEDDLPEDGSPREMIGSSAADGFCNEENMEIRICVNTYRLFFAQNTEDFMVQRRSQRLAGESKMQAVSGKRINKWHDFLSNAPWMQGMSQEEVERKKAEWEVAKKNGQPTDVVMGGA